MRANPPRGAPGSHGSTPPPTPSRAAALGRGPPLGVPPPPPARGCARRRPPARVATSPGACAAPRGGRHRGHGVALVRQRRRPPTPRRAALGHLPHLGGGEQDDVAGDLADHRGGLSQCGGELRACGSCATAAPARPARARRRTARAPARRRRRATPGCPLLRPAAPPGGAADLVEAGGGLVEPDEPARGLQPERDRQRVLQQRPPATRVSRWAAARPTAASAAASRSSSSGASARCATSMAAESSTSWLVAPRCTAPPAGSGTAAVSARTSGMTGLPPSAASAPARPRRTGRRRSRRDRVRVGGGQEPGARLGAGEAASTSSIAWTRTGRRRRPARRRGQGRRRTGRPAVPATAAQPAAAAPRSPCRRGSDPDAPAAAARAAAGETPSPSR